MRIYRNSICYGCNFPAHSVNFSILYSMSSWLIPVAVSTKNGGQQCPLSQISAKNVNYFHFYALKSVSKSITYNSFKSPLKSIT